MVHFFWSKILLFLCACHKSVMNFIPQPQERKSCRMPTQYVLIYYVDVIAPNLFGVVLCNPFKWDILCSFLTKKHVVVSVPSTPAIWISFHNHMDRKVVGGKLNALILYVNACAPNLSGVVLCNPFKWDILCSFLTKKLLFLCLPHQQNEYHSTTTWREML